MAFATLLHLPEETSARYAFVFDHDQLHRRENKITYLLNPMQNESFPKTKWHQDHQLAHSTLSPSGTFILGETDLSNPGQKAWWELANMLEHLIIELELEVAPFRQK